jgi:hypothetical protein
MMLKLTYSIPQDEFQTVTVLGSPEGIFDLWFRLKEVDPKYPTHGFASIKVHNLDGGEIDMRKGLRNAVCSATGLSRLCH